MAKLSKAFFRPKTIVKGLSLSSYAFRLSKEGKRDSTIAHFLLMKLIEAEREGLDGKALIGWAKVGVNLTYFAKILPYGIPLLLAEEAIRRNLPSLAAFLIFLSYSLYSLSGKDWIEKKKKNVRGYVERVLAILGDVERLRRGYFETLNLQGKL